MSKELREGDDLQGDSSHGHGHGGKKGTCAMQGAARHRREHREKAGLLKTTSLNGGKHRKVLNTSRTK